MQPRTTAEKAASIASGDNAPGGRHTDALRSYLETVRRLFDAAIALLLLDSGQGPDCEPLLLATGTPGASPALTSESSGAKLLEAIRVCGRDNARGGTEEAVHYYCSTCKGVRVIRIDAVGSNTASLVGPRPRPLIIERRLNAPAQDDWPQGAVWIGLSYEGSEIPEHLRPSAPNGAEQRSAQPLSAPEWMIRVLRSGAQLAWQVYELSSLAKDPTTGLEKRPELQSYVARCLTEGPKKQQLFVVALINPDGFGQVNQRMGHDKGDLVLREIASLLQSRVRHPDRLFHYGSAVFSVVLRVGNGVKANEIVERIRQGLSEHLFLDGAVRIGFSAGLWVSPANSASGDTLDSAEVLLRANSALSAAKVSGGGQTAVWEAGGPAMSIASNDRLLGIFTADIRKDYRNMLLLWDAVQTISSHSEIDEIAGEFVQLIFRAFKPNRVSLISSEDDNALRLLATADGYPERSGIDAPRLTEESRRLIARARKSRKAERVTVAPDQGREEKQPLSAYAIPLLSGAHYLGALYLDGPVTSLRLDSSDLVFLTVLAQQFAAAMDRARLVMRWKSEQESQSQQLRGEVRELREALQHSRVIFRSAQMQRLFDLVRKVAPSDATVLVTGESGTGKEVIARALHEHSLRSKKPFVVVDCGVIAHSLMERELFGHVKGAYTGAGARSAGRIQQAEGGTLFLDEIAEIPLDVQAKLLRFVQEREIMPVGGNRSRQVNVRILAATNRDLAEEVATGRFRQDLYYRLQVITLTVPPLRERADDILPLARYFLEKFALQYEKGVRCLTVEAESALREFPWPGNVRELQNRMLQAVITCGSEQVDRCDLRLSGPDGDNPVSSDGHLPPRVGAGQESSESPLANARPTSGEVSASDPLCGSVRPDDPWAVLSMVLARQVEVAIDRGDAVPLGSWLTEDLVVAADRAHGGNARKAALALGMAETTFRRHKDNAKRHARAGLWVRTEQWSLVAPAIQGVLASGANDLEENLLLKARRLLLKEVYSRLPDNDALASSLLGITVPTYRNWKSGDSTPTRMGA